MDNIYVDRSVVVERLESFLRFDNEGVLPSLFFDVSFSLFGNVNSVTISVLDTGFNFHYFNFIGIITLDDVFFLLGRFGDFFSVFFSQFFLKNLDYMESNLRLPIDV